jgi:hypothetical protein
MSTPSGGRQAAWWQPAFAGFRGVSWQTVALILAINTGYAAILSIEDSRPFWHPFITAQCFGLSIAYMVNAACPWNKTHPVWRLILAVAIGTAVGYMLVWLVKGRIIAEPGYTLLELLSDSHKFGWTLLSGFSNGLFVSLFFLFQFREARARADLLKADADRNLLSKQAIEAQLKLMQAQVEPHFLFNTLANVQHLVETDAPSATRMLESLIQYLRAALPQMREGATNLGREVDMARAFLDIHHVRMGSRMEFVIDVPEPLRARAFPPMMLISLVENAVKHGVDPCCECGSITIRAAEAEGRLRVLVEDTGEGIKPKKGGGVGLANIRERLKALYGPSARLVIEEREPHGVVASIEVPA